MNKKTVGRRAAAATGICLIGLAMAACQVNGVSASASNSPTAVATSAGTLPPDASTTGAPTAGASQADPSSVPTTAATGSAGGTTESVNQGVAACAGSQIHVTTRGDGAAMSHTGITLIFTNTGNRICSLTGYAGAALTYNNGHRWNATRAMESYLGGDSVDKTPVTVVLKPGAAASDLLSWTVIAPDGQPCQGHGSTSLLVTTPGTSDTQVLENGEAGACAYFTITPVVPGSTGSK